MERLAARAQTVVLDTLLAAIAFALAFFVAPIQPELGFGQAGALSFFQLCAVYAAIAGAFSLLFRRELSPWRYVSIPDALVLARCALLTVGVFLLAVFVLDRAEGLPRSTLVMAPLFQMAICMGVRIARRALHEHALESFSPLQSMADRVSQSSSLLLIGPSSLADAYLRGVARSNDHTYTPVGIIGTERRDVGQQVRGVCILDDDADGQIDFPGDRGCSAAGDAREGGCEGHALWQPVSCIADSWMWSSDRAFQDLQSANDNQVLYSGCNHSGDNGQGLCSLDGTGWVSTDTFVMAGCDASWWHIGGRHTGGCGGHDGDTVRYLALGQDDCWEYR